MTIIIDIDTGNAAFEQPGQETARILRKLADQVEHWGGAELEISLRDINGNRVGMFHASEGA